MLTSVFSGQRGFTLIELMVVVLIIGLLAGIAVPRLAGAWYDAKASTCKSNLKQIESALELYYFENNEYPSALQDTEGEIQLQLKSLPNCPDSGEAYSYKLESGSYTLTCSKHGFKITDTSEDLDVDPPGSTP